MSITNEQAEARVRQYLALVAGGSAEEIAALYAEDAVLEDPVGSEPLRGREAIKGFYNTIAQYKISTELRSIRTSGGEAAFLFHIETDTGAGVAVLDPMENMIFDEEGQIISMRAWWNDADMTFA